jgi:hypothetical protein
MNGEGRSGFARGVVMSMYVSLRICFTITRGSTRYMNTQTESAQSEMVSGRMERVSSAMTQEILTEDSVSMNSTRVYARTGVREVISTIYSLSGLNELTVVSGNEVAKNVKRRSGS